MFPQIINLILSPSLNSPALREIERHLLGRVETVENHEDDTIARVPRPVLSRVRGIVDIVVVDSPSERRETLANNRVLVDLDNVSVPQDLKRLLRGIPEISTDEQRRLQKRPGSEMAFRFVVCQVTRRSASTSVPDLKQVQIIVSEEVGCFGMKRRRVDDGGKFSPPRFDVACIPPRLSDPAAPDPRLVPSPLAEGILESDIRASRELGDGVGHACEAADHAVLGDVVGWYVCSGRQFGLQ
jgi:hypothetical protein